MAKFNLDHKVLYGLLIILSIHTGGQILTSLLNNFHALIIPYEYLPWTRLLVVISEIVLILYLLEKLTKEAGLQVGKKQISKLTLLTTLLFIGSQFRGYLDDSYPIFCANALFDGTANLIYEAHAVQQSIVHSIETFLLGGTILVVGFLIGIPKTSNP